MYYNVSELDRAAIDALCWQGCCDGSGQSVSPPSYGAVECQPGLTLSWRFIKQAPTDTHVMQGTALENNAHCYMYASNDIICGLIESFWEARSTPMGHKSVYKLQPLFAHCGTNTFCYTQVPNSVPRAPNDCMSPRRSTLPQPLQAC